MRIAVLSDIHGNLEALEAVWADLAGCEPDRVICLGDMVGYGPNPEEVLQFVRARKVDCCMGNHELGIAFQQERRWFNATAKKGLSRTESMLSADSMAYIRELPRALQVEGAVCVHGFPPQNVTRYLFEVPDERVEAWFAGGVPMTFVGHTHELAVVRWCAGGLSRREPSCETLAVDEGAYIINAGSVGQPRDDVNRQAKYLLWDTLAKTVTVHCVAYDVNTTVAKIRALDLPEFYASRLL